MMTESQTNIFKEIQNLTRAFFEASQAPKFVPGKTRIPLNAPTYGWEEASDAYESILTTWVTMGSKVKKFERIFADYIGCKHAVMVNSGSSANLMAISALCNPALESPIRPGDEIITPAVTWATTVYPIINCGVVPVLVDVDVDTLNISVSEIERALTPKTRAIMPVHLLGNPCEIGPIMDMARRRNLYVIEDACEAHGAEIAGRKAGSFADLSTFSFFFSHHISTIEGGMILTSNDRYADLLRALRVFGWIRDLSNKEELARKHQDIDQRFLFVNIGYNFRPTEIQGAFGIHQMPRLEPFIELRRENARYWTEQLKKYSDYLVLYSEQPGTRHVWFGYPITVRSNAPFTRKELVDFLESRGVETRPIMVGNMDEQPGMKMFNYRTVGDLKNSRLVMRQSFFFGNHQGIGRVEREAIAEYFHEFFARLRR
jgi:CDP-6-deoxy-D-xylo-4-hexulose-3-dehydrase